MSPEQSKEEGPSAPHVRLADLPDRVRDGVAALPGGRPGGAERPGGHQVALRLVHAPLFETGEPGHLLLGESGQQPLDLLELPAHGVALLLLPVGQLLLLVQRLAGGGGQGVGPPGVVGQPVHRRGAVRGQPPHDMGLVQGPQGIAGQQQPEVRGELGTPLVLLPGQPPGVPAAELQRGPRLRQVRVHLLHLRGPLLQLLRGGVVGLARLLRRLVAGLQFAQQGGDAPGRVGRAEGGLGVDLRRVRIGRAGGVLRSLRSNPCVPCVPCVLRVLRVRGGRPRGLLGERRGFLGRYGARLGRCGGGGGDRERRAQHGRGDHAQEPA